MHLRVYVHSWSSWAKATAPREFARVNAPPVHAVEILHFFHYREVRHHVRVPASSVLRDWHADQELPNGHVVWAVQASDMKSYVYRVPAV